MRALQGGIAVTCQVCKHASCPAPPLLLLRTCRLHATSSALQMHQAWAQKLPGGLNEQALSNLVYGKWWWRWWWRTARGSTARCTCRDDGHLVLQVGPLLISHLAGTTRAPHSPPPHSRPQPTTRRPCWTASCCSGSSTWPRSGWSRASSPACRASPSRPRCVGQWRRAGSCVHERGGGGGSTWAGP